MRALLVIDVQNDFCPGGRLAVPDGDEVVPVINATAEHFEHVLFTQDWHPEGHSSFASTHPSMQPFDRIELDYGEQILWPDHCIKGYEGAAFHSDLNVRRGELILRKGFRKEIDSYSAFFENDHSTPTGLTGYLRERAIDTLYLAGLALDFCVHWSAVDGIKQGFNIVVLEDAARAIDTDGSLDQAMTRMRDAGVVMSTSDEIRSHAVG